MPRSRSSWLTATVAILLLLSTSAARTRQAPESFAARVAALSEPSGYFDTDNLISNERSYLHVVPALRELAVRGGSAGVYMGVGPDQNFSYIAHLRPSMAILIDIRRDNLLLHLLFKALFAETATRTAYLAMLTGRDPPPDSDAARTIDDIVSAIDRARPMTDAALKALRQRVAARVASFGVPLSEPERATIANFHGRFIADGLSLQFNTTGRAPQFNYPTFRDLLLETDGQGTRRNYLAAEADFRFLKDLQARDLVIPIVGNLAGSSALAAVGKFLAASKKQVSAFYTSNVEFYLFRDGTFPTFVSNLGRLPHQTGSVLIRSVFPGGGSGLAPPPGYNSASLTQPIPALLDGFAKGRFRQYWELVK